MELAGGAGSRAKQFKLTGLDLDGFRTQLERVSAGGARPGASATTGPEPRQPRPGV